METTQYERDFNDQKAFKRPGRIDFKLFQNVDDVGDGYPGLQKMIRNWYNLNDFRYDGHDVYCCSTETEINDALTSIGSGSGTILLIETIILTSTININGGGSYIIEGMGDKTGIDCGGDRTTFNITSAISCIFRDFKIDANDLETNTTVIIEVNEGSDNPVLFDNIRIDGDTVNGYGIVLTSDNCTVRNCYISRLRWGIDCLGTHEVITENHVYDCSNVGIRFGDYCTVENNIVSNCTHGIYGATNIYSTISGNISISNSRGISVYTSCSYNNIRGNICASNSKWGIYLYESSYNIINGNNCAYNGGANQNNCDGIVLDGIASVNEYNIISGNNANKNIAGTSVNKWGTGIYIFYAHNTISIGNNVCVNTDGGIKTSNSNYQVIIGNCCNDGVGDHVSSSNGGISLRDNDFSTIYGNNSSKNICTGAGWAIGIDNSYNNGSIISNNLCQGNENQNYYRVSETNCVDDQADRALNDLNRFS